MNESRTPSLRVPLVLVVLALLVGLAIPALASPLFAPLAPNAVLINNAPCTVTLDVLRNGICSGALVETVPTPLPTPPPPTISGYPAVVIADHPISYWRLGDGPGSTTISDQVGAHPGTTDSGAQLGLGHPGAFANDPTTSWFNDGSIHYWEVADSPALRLTAAWTIEAWFNTIELAGLHQQSILEKYGAGTTGGYLLRLAYWGGTLQGGALQNSYNWADLRGRTVITPNVWHLAQFTYDGTTLRVYLDGILDGEVARPSTITVNQSQTPLIVGEEGDAAVYPPNSGYSSPFRGSLQELALYSYPLNAAQVAVHFNAGKAAGLRRP